MATPDDPAYDPEEALRQKIREQAVTGAGGKSDPLAPADFGAQRNDQSADRPDVPTDGAYTGPAATTNDTPAVPEKDPTAPPAAEVYTGPQATTNSAALPGWDQQKWDSDHNSVKYQFGRMAAGIPQGDRAAMSAQIPGLVSQLQAQNPNVKMVGDDKIDFGDGFGPIDVLTGQGTWAWTPPDQAGKGGAPTGSSYAGPAAQGSSYASHSSSSSGGGGGANDAYMAQLRQMVMDRLRAASQPVDENAPGILDAVTAARNEGTRQGETERSALAERLYAQGDGLNTDALTRQIQQSGEKNAANIGGLRASLIMKEVDARRTDLREILQMALASGDAQAARDTQTKIAELDALVKREGYDLDAKKWEEEAALRRDAMNLDAGKFSAENERLWSQG